MAALCFLGIDPGMTGAIAFYFPSAPELISVEDMPVAGGEVNAAELGERIAQMKPDAAVIELQGARPESGRSAMFKLGVSYGVALGAVSVIKTPFRTVSPGKWKAHFGLSSDKEVSRAWCIKRWPERAELFARKKDHNRAEAALLALYAAEVAFRSWGEPEERQ